MNELILIKEKKRSKSIIDAIYIFLIAAFLGWSLEVLYVYMVTGHLVHRGMCYGPVCTIYGIAALLLYITYGSIEKNWHDIIFTFLTSSVILGAFELVSGIVLKRMGIEMWNYHGQFLAIFDYTTVPIAIGWGVFACIYLYFIQPLFLKLVHILPKQIYTRLALILISIYFIDYSASNYAIHHNPEILYKLVHP